MADFPETECGKNCDDLTRLENGTGRHLPSAHDNDLRADKIARYCSGAVAKYHGDHLP